MRQAGNISETGYKPKQDYHLKCDYEYNENITLPKVQPHCNCEGCFEFNGLQASSVVKGGGANLKVTKATNDICDFCGHYVMYREEVINDRGKHHIGRKGKSNGNN